MRWVVLKHECQSDGYVGTGQSKKAATWFASPLPHAVPKAQHSKQLPSLYALTTSPAGGSSSSLPHGADKQLNMYAQQELLLLQGPLLQKQLDPS